MTNEAPIRPAAAADVLIRPAAAADALELATLAGTSVRVKFGHLYPPAVLEAFLAEVYTVEKTLELIRDEAVWVVDGGVRLLGYAVVRPCKLPHPDVTPGCVELRRLYTAPDLTGAGIGTRLMQAVVMPACERAVGDGWLGVYSDNVDAQRFYARFGFVKAGEYAFPVGPIRDREFILRRRRGWPRA